MQAKTSSRNWERTIRRSTRCTSAFLFASVLIAIALLGTAYSARGAEESPLAVPSAPEAQKANRDSSAIVPPPVTPSSTKGLFAEEHPRLILVLSGGAGKSLAQIGVIRKLERHQIPIDAVVGTSMGATIGALYCAGMSPDQMEQLFLNKKLPHSLMSGIISGKILHPLMKIAYLIAGKPYVGASSGKGYMDFLKEHLPSTFADLKIPFAAVATDITDGRTCVLTSGDLRKAVRASASVPLLYRPVQIGCKLYVDGGLGANLPAELAQKMSDGIVVSVLCDKAVKPVPNSTFKSKLALVMRITDIMIGAADKLQAKASDVLIYPNVDFVPIVPSKQDVHRAIAAGEASAEQVIPQIVKRLDEQERKRRFATRTRLNTEIP